MQDRLMQEIVEIGEDSKLKKAEALSIAKEAEAATWGFAENRAGRRAAARAANKRGRGYTR